MGLQIRLCRHPRGPIKSLVMLRSFYSVSLPHKNEIPRFPITAFGNDNFIYDKNLPRKKFLKKGLAIFKKYAKLCLWKG